ncbi:hypothetical protein QJQ45_005385 [Haematococcus lacustris]|nr:hypothetical protein QJQ45_005385 [Haematococcus lacustris]
MYPIFRKPQSGRLPTTAEHPSQYNHIASQRSVTTSADDEGVESKVKKGSSDGAWVSKQKYGITDSMRKDHGHWIKPILGSPDRVSCRFCLHPQSIQARKATVDTHAASVKHSNATAMRKLQPTQRQGLYDGKGYMCIFMHSMDRDFVRQATFVDLPPVDGATADDLLDLLLATVGSKLQLSMEQLGSKLVSFGCDGASVLQGAHTGVVVQLRTKVAPFVQGVWCHAHRGQLAGKAIEDTPVISKLNSLSSTLAHYFCRSPKRQGELRAISRNLLGTDVKVLRRVPTRWVSLLSPLRRILRLRKTFTLKTWWYFTMAMALVTAALDPFKLSFVEEAGLYPYTDFWAVTDYITTVIFLIDMVLKFMLMFQDAEGGLVRDHKVIALNYLRFLFWVDLVTTLPLDGFVSIALGYRYRSDSAAGLYVALVRWVKLGRLYRIFDLFAMLEHKMVISQVSLILLRNNIYIAFITHWMACLFYYVARAELFSERSWVGRNSWRFDDQGVGVRYVYSLYFSVSAFAGLGDGDFYCASPAESIVMIIFLLGNIVFQAYILGTVTFVLVKADEKSKVYRERMEALRGYAGINDLPQPLMEMMKVCKGSKGPEGPKGPSMMEHIELQYHNEQCSDEMVLANYPATIRRKVLRHLYLSTVKSCYLFRGAKARFMDAFLAATRMELYMPQATTHLMSQCFDDVSVLSEGDVVSELYIIIDGTVCGCAGMGGASLNAMRRNSVLGLESSSQVAAEQAKSIVANRRRSMVMAANLPGAETGMLNPQASINAQPSYPSSNSHPMLGSQALRDTTHVGAVTFTQTAPPSQTVDVAPWQGDGLRSLASQGSGLQGLGGHKDNSHGVVNTYTESMCFGEVPFFTEAPCLESVWTVSVTRVLVLSRAGYDSLVANFTHQARCVDCKDVGSSSIHTAVCTVPLSKTLLAKPMLQLTVGTTPAKRLLLTNLRNHAEREFLDELAMAASFVHLDPDVAEQLREMVTTGRLPGSNSVRHAAPPSVAPNSPRRPPADETTVFVDAIKKQLNKAQVARLEQLDQVRALVAGFLSKQESQKVFEFLQAAAASDMQALRSLMSQGVGPNATDYDDRTALMVASHKGLVAVATLLLDAAADPNRVDAFGNTALLEAVKGGHMEVMEVLLDAGAVLGLDDTAAASLLCKAVIDGDVAKLKQWLKAGVPVNVCDYDNRTPLHVAASEGNLYAVELLVETGGANVCVEDRWGHTPLGDAVAAGHSSVVDFLAPLYEAQVAAKANQGTKGSHDGWGQCPSEAGSVRSLRSLRRHRSMSKPGLPVGLSDSGYAAVSNSGRPVPAAASLLDPTHLTQGLAAWSGLRLSPSPGIRPGLSTQYEDVNQEGAEGEQEGSSGRDSGAPSSSQGQGCQGPGTLPTSSSVTTHSCGGVAELLAPPGQGLRINTQQSSQVPQPGPVPGGQVEHGPGPGPRPGQREVRQGEGGQGLRELLDCFQLEEPLGGGADTSQPSPRTIMRLLTDTGSEARLKAPAADLLLNTPSDPELAATPLPASPPPPSALQAAAVDRGRPQGGETQARAAAGLGAGDAVAPAVRAVPKLDLSQLAKPDAYSMPTLHDKLAHWQASTEQGPGAERDEGETGSKARGQAAFTLHSQPPGKASAPLRQGQSHERPSFNRTSSSRDGSSSSKPSTPSLAANTRLPGQPPSSRSSSLGQPAAAAGVARRLGSRPSSSKQLDPGHSQEQQQAHKPGLAAGQGQGQDQSGRPGSAGRAQGPPPSTSLAPSWEHMEHGRVVAQAMQASAASQGSRSASPNPLTGSSILNGEQLGRPLVPGSNPPLPAAAPLPPPPPHPGPPPVPVPVGVPSPNLLHGSGTPSTTVPGLASHAPAGQPAAPHPAAVAATAREGQPAIAQRRSSMLLLSTPSTMQGILEEEEYHHTDSPAESSSSGSQPLAMPRPSIFLPSRSASLVHRNVTAGAAVGAGHQPAHQPQPGAPAPLELPNTPRSLQPTVRSDSSAARSAGLAPAPPFSVMTSGQPVPYPRPNTSTTAVPEATSDASDWPWNNPASHVLSPGQRQRQSLDVKSNVRPGQGLALPLPSSTQPSSHAPGGDEAQHAFPNPTHPTPVQAFSAYSHAAPVPKAVTAAGVALPGHEPRGRSLLKVATTGGSGGWSAAPDDLLIPEPLDPEQHARRAEVAYGARVAVVEPTPDEVQLRELARAMADTPDIPDLPDSTADGEEEVEHGGPRDGGSQHRASNLASLGANASCGDTRHALTALAQILTFLKNCSSARSWAPYNLSRVYSGSKYTSHTASQQDNIFASLAVKCVAECAGKPSFNLGDLLAAEAEHSVALGRTMSSQQARSKLGLVGHVRRCCQAVYAYHKALNASTTIRNSFPHSSASKYSAISGSSSIDGRMFRGKHSKGLARFGLPKGAMLLYIDDLYHTLLNMPRYRFLLSFFSVYLLLYLSTTEECLGGEPSFTHVFWFSVQTASTIGYSSYLAPSPDCAGINFLATFQIICAALIDTMLMSLVFSRWLSRLEFAAPMPRASTIRFSQHAVLSRQEQDHLGDSGSGGGAKPGPWLLSFRLANIRKHCLLDPEITSLKLGLPATITHVIDAHSPLYELSLGQMEAAEMELLCFMSGTDPMTSNLLQSRHSYTPADIRVNERFVGINLQTNARGKLGLDFTNFDHTVPTEQGLSLPSLPPPHSSQLAQSADALRSQCHHLRNLPFSSSAQAAAERPSRPMAPLSHVLKHHPELSAAGERAQPAPALQPAYSLSDTSTSSYSAINGSVGKRGQAQTGRDPLGGQQTHELVLPVSYMPGHTGNGPLPLWPMPSPHAEGVKAGQPGGDEGQDQGRGLRLSRADHAQTHDPGRTAGDVGQPGQVLQLLQWEQAIMELCEGMLHDSGAATHLRQQAGAIKAALAAMPALGSVPSLL